MIGEHVVTALGILSLAIGLYATFVLDWPGKSIFGPGSIFIGIAFLAGAEFNRRERIKFEAESAITQEEIRKTQEQIDAVNAEINQLKGYP